MALGVLEVVDARDTYRASSFSVMPDLGARVDRPEQGRRSRSRSGRHPRGRPTSGRTGRASGAASPAAVVEVRAERARLLEQGDRGPRLTPVRHRPSRERSGREPAAPGPPRIRAGREELLEQHPGPSRVVGRVVAGREPVGRPAGLRRPVRRDEELAAPRSRAAITSRGRARAGRSPRRGPSRRETPPGARRISVSRIARKRSAADCQSPAASRSSASIRCHCVSASARNASGDGPEPPCQVAQRRDRRLDQAVLERADVGLRVARLGELPLGQSAPASGLPSAASRPVGEVAILLGEARAAPDPRARSSPPDHTQPLNRELTRSPLPGARAALSRRRRMPVGQQILAQVQLQPTMSACTSRRGLGRNRSPKMRNPPSPNHPGVGDPGNHHPVAVRGDGTGGRHRGPDPEVTLIRGQAPDDATTADSRNDRRDQILVTGSRPRHEEVAGRIEGSAGSRVRRRDARDQPIRRSCRAARLTPGMAAPPDAAARRRASGDLGARQGDELVRSIDEPGPRRTCWPPRRRPPTRPRCGRTRRDPRSIRTRPIRSCGNDWTPLRGRRS